MKRSEPWFASLPEKGERVRVSGCNDAGQRFEPYEGVVVGYEHRTSPPLMFVVADGYDRQVSLYPESWQKWERVGG